VQIPVPLWPKVELADIGFYGGCGAIWAPCDHFRPSRALETISRRWKNSGFSITMQVWSEIRAILIMRDNRVLKSNIVVQNQLRESISVWLLSKLAALFTENSKLSRGCRPKTKSDPISFVISTFLFWQYHSSSSESKFHFVSSFFRWIFMCRI